MKATHLIKRFCRRLLRGSVLTALVLTQLLWTLPTRVRGDDKLCFTPLIFTGPPTIDGLIAGDPGWNNAVSYVFNNGSTDPHTVVRLVRDSGNVYMAFEVNNDPSFENEDVIAVAFGPDAIPANDRRILIHPVATGVGNATAAPGGPPQEVEYWTNSSTWNTSAKIVPNPLWLQSTDGSAPNPMAPNNIRVTSTSNAVPMKSYFVEMRLPINNDPAQGINFPSAADFLLYFNVVRVTTNMGSIESLALGELSWPTTADDVAGADPAPIGIETNMPARAQWGAAGISGSGCNGVAINRILSNNPDPTLINVNSTNNLFSAELINTGSAPASGVRATFRSSRFGIASPGIYTPIPAASPHPTDPSGTINPGGGLATVTTGPWDVLNDLNRPSYVDDPSICVQVTLTSTVGGTQIVEPIDYLNMHFGTASRFEHAAVINAKGFDAPPDGASNQQFDIFASVRKEEQRRDTYQQDPTGRRKGSAAPEQFISRLYRIMHVYRRTGRFIRIKGKKFRVSESVNSFGYIIQHVGGVVAEWKQDLKGSGLTKIADGIFTVAVPKDGEVTLTTKVESREKKKRCFQSTAMQNPFGIPGGMLMLGLVVYACTRRGRRKRDA